jgi:hypothetical protein
VEGGRWRRRGGERARVCFGSKGIKREGVVVRCDVCHERITPLWCSFQEDDKDLFTEGVRASEEARWTGPCWAAWAKKKDKPGKRRGLVRDGEIFIV